jgi:hypothetical protein
MPVKRSSRRRNDRDRTPDDVQRALETASARAASLIRKNEWVLRKTRRMLERIREEST